MRTELPIDLANAITGELSSFSLRSLRRATIDLSERYRGDLPANSARIENDLDAAAYAAYRMPATYAAVLAVLDQLRLRLPDWTPRTFLDAGAGTGAGFWAVTRHWPDLECVTLLDRCAPMLDLGQRLAQHSGLLAIRTAKWLRGDMRSFEDETTSDLVLASYVMNELDADELEQTVDRLWRRTGEVFVHIEPGTPSGSGAVKAVRAMLVDRGAHIIAPCPHDRPCPMPDDDWCHFSVRLPRGRLHREVKPGELGFEDEKFSYFVASKISGTQAEGRILRHPEYRRGMVRLTVCGRDGITIKTVTRRHGKPLYREARNATWGDEFPGAEI